MCGGRPTLNPSNGRPRRAFHLHRIACACVDFHHAQTIIGDYGLPGMRSAPMWKVIALTNVGNLAASVLLGKTVRSLFATQDDGVEPVLENDMVSHAYGRASSSQLKLSDASVAPDANRPCVEPHVTHLPGLLSESL